MIRMTFSPGSHLVRATGVTVPARRHRAAPVTHHLRHPLQLVLHVPDPSLLLELCSVSRYLISEIGITDKIPELCFTGRLC